MAAKSQEEKEQLVKVYQLDEVSKDVKGVSDLVTREFERVNTSLDTLIIKTQTQVTPQQLEANLAALRTVFDDKIDEEIKKVHLEYRPIKKTINWLLATVVGAAIAIFGQVVFILNLTKGG